MNGYDALRTTAAVIRYPGHGHIRVTGTDALSFLQSLLSQDLAPLGSGEGAHALLLQPQGKLDADLRVLVGGPDEVWLDCEDAPGAVAALNRFRIRVDATLADLSAERTMIGIRGPQAVGVVEAILGVAVPESAFSFVRTDDCVVVRADWPGNPGVDILGPTDAVASLVARCGLPVADEDAAERLRIECGVPRQGPDIDATTIPQEAGLERDAVSFTKGCFLGQELVCRIDSRGHVNRFLRVLTLDGPVSVGAPVIAEDREVGVVTSVASTDRGAVALAYVRREIEPGATVDVAGPAAPVTGEVSALPEVLPT